MIRFEITEEPSAGVDGQRFMHVPGRGLFAAAMSANGDVLLSEHRLRTLMIKHATRKRSRTNSTRRSAPRGTTNSSRTAMPARARR